MKMVIYILQCFCFTVNLSIANVVMISVFVMTLIPPKMMTNYPFRRFDDYGLTEEETLSYRNVTVVEDFDTKLRRFYLDCIIETGIDPKLVIQFRAGYWLDDPDFKRWSFCVLYKRGLITRQGVYRYDVAMSKIKNKDKDAVDKIIDKCLSKKAMLPRDIAWKYLKCYHLRNKQNEFPSLGILLKF